MKYLTEVEHRARDSGRLASQVREAPSSAHAGGLDDLVRLDPDHPGFRDGAYRKRRNDIARLALEYEPGTPVPAAEYTDQEHAVWRTIWEQLDLLHDRFACRQYKACSAALKLPRHRVPQLSEVNALIKPATSFRMLPVAGLVAPRRFLEYLGDDVFLSTQYIRHHSTPFYTPEPDVVHELVGHAATFMSEDFAQLNRAFGRAAKKLPDERIHEIERVYWFSLEFGAVKEDGELKVYGAGLLSSFGEVERFQKEAELRPFDVEDMVETPYDPTDYQNTIFVADSFADMARGLLDWLEAL